MANNLVSYKKGEGEALWVVGDLFEVKLPSDDCDGAMTILEVTAPPGPSVLVPEHTHPGDETVYVLEGSVRWHFGDKFVDLPAGSLLHIPMGTSEWAENVTKTPVRALIIYTGAAAGTEKFLREAGEPAKSRTVPPPSKTDLQRMNSIGKKYGVHVKVPSAEAEQQP
jgi:quercetin dioxygenase-like cupin family protein